MAVFVHFGDVQIVSHVGKWVWHCLNQGFAFSLPLLGHGSFTNKKLCVNDRAISLMTERSRLVCGNQF